MFSFNDLNGYRVDLSFEKGNFSIEPQHVLVLAQKNHKWLLTNHPKRGIEFPGGKKEVYETREEAAIRETLEETNVSVYHLEWFAEYLVHDVKPFCKAVFIAEVKDIHTEAVNYETNGAVWLTSKELEACPNLSFHMKDKGMQAILKEVMDYEGKWND
ncbi:MAG: NUDIX domain-containing protein [Psychrobacillus sp.]